MEAAAGYNIIGDIAGQYKTLLKLVNKMPKGPVILVGDLIDRGPNSRKVVAWARANQDWVLTLMGNHGHNARDKVKWYKDRVPGMDWDEPAWGANIDTSLARTLTGLHWPSLQIFQQEYVD